MWSNSQASFIMFASVVKDFINSNSNQLKAMELLLYLSPVDFGNININT